MLPQCVVKIWRASCKYGEPSFLYTQHRAASVYLDTQNLDLHFLAPGTFVGLSRS